jgi:competence protein ComGC
MKQYFLFLIFILLSIFVNAREVSNTNSGIAYASPGDYIIRSNGQRYVLNQGDINHARRQLGLPIPPNRPTSSSNNSGSSNSRTNVSSSSSYPSPIVLIIIGIIIIFIIRKIIKHNEEMEYEQQRERQRQQYEQQVKRQRQQYEFEIQQQKIAEEKRIEGNLNWLKSVRSGKEIYNNAKLYITGKEWQIFNNKFQFLKVTLLDRIIFPDEKIMKPYLKCFIYGSSNN